MSVVVVWDLTFKSGRAADFRRWMNEAVPEALSYGGLLGLKFCGDQDDPDRLLVIEEWESRQRCEQYFLWRMDAGVARRFAEMLVRPVAPRYFNPIDLRSAVGPSFA